MKPIKRSGDATPKRPSARDAASGKFEAASPQTDPALFDQLVRSVRAIRDLEPMLAGMVLMFKQVGDENSAAMASACGLYLSQIKNSALASLAADPESVRELKKKRADAKRLGGVPLEEQQRIQREAEEWKLDGVTPYRLAQSAPHVLQSVMALVGASAVRVVDGDGLVLGLAAEPPKLDQKGGES